MNSQFRKYLVFGQTKEIGVRFLENILDNIQYGKVKQVKKSKNDMFVELKDGSTYQAIGASDGARGYRCNVAFVDKYIDSKIVDEIIKPLIINGNWEEAIIYIQ